MNFIPPVLRKMVMAAVVVTTFGGISLFFQQSFLKKSQNLNTLNSGLETCFNRVSQTFTALMIQDMASTYLTSDFLAMSTDCFSELNKQSIQITASVEKLNKLMSETHWFHEKVQKIQKNTSPTTTLLGESNINDKFSVLENLKDSLQETFINEQESLLSKANLWKVTAILLLSTLAGLLLLGISIAKKMRSNVVEIESMATTILSEEDISSSKFSGLVEMALTEVNMPQTLNVVQKYHNTLIEEISYAKTNEKINEIETSDVAIQADRPIVNLNSIFDVSLKGIQHKAFNHGIILDFDLQDEMSVYADEEGVQQIFYSLLNYAIDASLKHNFGRKILVRSYILGDVINLNFSIQNYTFNASELNYLSANIKNEELDSNVLVLKEILELMDLDSSFTNKMSSDSKTNSAQISISFERAPLIIESDLETIKSISADQLELGFEYGEKIATQPKTVSIIKGSKKEVLNRLNEMKNGPA